jgi:hypothetical protein
MKYFPEFAGRCIRIATVNKESHIYILRRRSEGNAPENWRTNSWFPLHDNAPAHRSVLVTGFLKKNDVTTPERPA